MPRLVYPATVSALLSRNFVSVTITKYFSFDRFGEKKSGSSMIAPIAFSQWRVTFVTRQTFVFNRAKTITQTSLRHECRELGWRKHFRVICFTLILVIAGTIEYGASGRTRTDKGSDFKSLVFTISPQTQLY